MIMRNPEALRTVAQFLNGIAVAVLMAGVIGPLSLAAAQGPTVLISIAVAAALHGAALLALSWRR